MNMIGTKTEAAGTAMKIPKRTIIILSIIVLLCIPIFMLYKPNYYRFFYSDDRIKGNIKVITDNQVFHIGSENIILHYPGKAIDSNDAVEISFPAGEYGEYSFEVTNISLDAPIRITCYQPNWWNVQSFELTLSIDTLTKTISYNGHYSTLSDNGEKIQNTISTTQNYDTENCCLFFGL